MRINKLMHQVQVVHFQRSKESAAQNTENVLADIACTVYETSKDEKADYGARTGKRIEVWTFPLDMDIEPYHVRHGGKLYKITEVISVDSLTWRIIAELKQ